MYISIYKKFLFISNNNMHNILSKKNYNFLTEKKLHKLSFCDILIDIAAKKKRILATDVQILNISLKKNNIFSNFSKGDGYSIVGGKTPAMLGLPMKKGILKNIFSDYVLKYVQHIQEVLNTNRKLNYKDLEQNVVKPLNERNSIAVRPFSFNKKLFSVKMNVNKKLQGTILEVINNKLKIINTKKKKKNVKNKKQLLKQVNVFSLENIYSSSFNGCRLGKLRRRWKRKSKKIELKGYFRFNLQKNKNYL